MFLCIAANLGCHVKLVDLKTGQCSHQLELEASMSCAWSPVSDYLLAAGGSNSTVKLWDIRSSKKCLTQLVVCHANTKNYSRVNGVVFTPDGSRIITACDDVITSWDAEYYNKLNVTYDPVENNISKSINFDVVAYDGLEVCFVPSGNKVQLFNIKNGKQLNVLSGHLNTCNSVQYNSTSMELYSAGDDNRIIRWKSRETTV